MRPVKQDTFILVSKCFAFVAGGFCVNIATSMGQWANSGEWPSRSAWVVIIAGALGSAFLAYVTFLSTSYSDYQRKLSLTRGEKQA